MPRHRLSTLVACTTAFATTLLGSATDARAATVEHHSGTLSDGATWIADKPARWNGTLLLFSHGFGPTIAADAPSAAAQQALLDAGYALAGSSYDPHGSMWALDSAERDQFATLATFRGQVGSPSRVISVGQSMGGLVNAQIARDGAGRVNGSLGLCGLVAGGVDLDNYQLDAEYSLATFLDPADADKLVDLASQAEATALAERLSNAVETAQQTLAGRARIALAAAYLNLADWAPGQQPPARDDFTGQERQQYTWLAQGLLGFLVPARWSVEQSAGGNTSWNTGVDYAGLLRKSAHAKQVTALYRGAGLNLGTDLNRLTRGADITADRAALAHLERTSSAGQGVAVPMLDIHTIADQLVPVEQESAFAGRVRGAGDSARLRLAYVARQSHCNFTTAEVVAGLHAVEHRLDTGHWGDAATAGQLQDSATELNLGGAAFTEYRPSGMTGTR
ncbi:alpha/beta hydrolase [Streptomyces sp. NPDC091209]|uniref:alpha/beta hydrolase n=1 Tax=Streptomyces sp. NPDC091209 TaxID=3365974 RepID=UPI00382EC81D